MAGRSSRMDALGVSTAKVKRVILGTPDNKGDPKQAGRDLANAIIEKLRRDRAKRDQQKKQIDAQA